MANYKKVKSLIQANERIKSLLNGQPVDKVPVWLWLLSPTVAAPITGYTSYDVFSDPKKSFKAQIGAAELFGSDDIPRACFGGDAAVPFGGEIKLPTGEFEQAPSIIRYPINSEADVANLTIPSNIMETAPLPLYREFAGYQKEYGFPLSLWCDSPFELVRGLCGTNNLCRWLIKKPDVIFQLLDFSVNYVIEMVKDWSTLFPLNETIIYTVAPTTSNQIISPAQFEKFAFPYEKERNEKLLDLGVKHIFCHICGEQNANLEYWAQIPLGKPGIASIGHEVSISKAIHYLGANNIIAGNIQPAIIQSASPQEIYDLSRKVIEEGKSAPKGFILMPGCGISHKTIPYSVYMLKKAADDYGWY